ncbi:Aminopeptidase Q [Acromyrmex echinatior]|uniref:Aminopeptidase Q n=2 Tax=Acromyrmex echinatior TaxID=103372 RepID=F4WW55_ACREC|nr:Aminopeptidase Q [Acromyrmex echinatior]
MLLKSLSCSENSDIIINYLNITTFNTLLFHEKERSFIIKSILDKHLNNTLILDYILNNFETIKAKSFTTTTIMKLILRNVFYDKQIDKAFKTDINMGFLNLLLNLTTLVNLHIILITNSVFCTNKTDNLKIIRLPNNTVPLFYNISLLMNLEEENFTFHGESNIEIEIRYASLNNISLHSKELELNEMATKLINVNGTVYKPTEHSHDNKTDILTLNFKNALSPGFYTLNMKFAGIINENNISESGFIMFPYTNKGKNNTLVASYSEPKGARRMFPCWDEPALKAIFNISIMHHVKYLALSNMPLVQREFFENDMTCTYFNISPIMSTYLVEIIVFPMIDFHHLSNEKETINVWCRSSLISQMTFMFNITEMVTPFLIQYINNSEKVPKMDHFIIPNFPVKDMEHWGLITYK